MFALLVRCLKFVFILHYNTILSHWTTSRNQRRIKGLIPFYTCLEVSPQEVIDYKPSGQSKPGKEIDLLFLTILLQVKIRCSVVSGSMGSWIEKRSNGLNDTPHGANHLKKAGAGCLTLYNSAEQNINLKVETKMLHLCNLFSA